MNNEHKHDLKKYIGIMLCLFGSIALSIILFFLIYKWDVVKSTFSHISKTLMPFIIGSVLAYIICPLCNNIEKIFIIIFNKAGFKNEEKKNKTAFTLSVFSGIIITIVIIYIFLMIVIPNIISSVVRLAQILPGSAENLITWLKKIIDENAAFVQISEDIIDKSTKMVEDWISTNLLANLQNLAAGFSSGVISIVVVLMNIFIGFIVAIYLLLSRKKLARQGKLIIYSIFKNDTADSIMEEITYADKVFGGFINGKILDAIIVSIICYIGLMIFSLCNPGKTMMSETLISVIVGIFNVIPFFGWYIALFIGALLALMVNPMQCIFFLIFDIILQQIDGNILGPKIIGNTTGLSSFWVLFSILLFGDIWGFAGMLIGVPLFAVIYHIIKKLVFKGLRKNGQGKMLQQYEKDYPEKPKKESLREEILDMADKKQNI